MLVCVLVASALCVLEMEPLDEIFVGSWNITRVSVTEKGLENPDTLSYELKLVRSGDSNTFIGEMNRILSDHSTKGEHLLKIVMKEDRKIEFYIDDVLEIDAPLEQSVDNVLHLHGVLDRRDVTFSFVILSSYRAELTIFDRQSKAVVVFRCMKDFESTKLTSVWRMLSYFAQKVIFRGI